MTNPGNFNRLIVIEKVVSQGDIMGAGTSPSWGPHASLWARIEQSSSEQNVARGEREVKTATFWTWFWDGITTDMRVNFQGIWKIVGIVEVGYREGLRIDCERHV